MAHFKNIAIEPTKDGETVIIKVSNNGWQWTVHEVTKEELKNAVKLFTAAIKNKNNWATPKDEQDPTTEDPNMFLDLKCANCGKRKGVHRSKDLACPLGSRHKTIGYTQFYNNQFYKPRQSKKKT